MPHYIKINSVEELRSCIGKKIIHVAWLDWFKENPSRIPNNYYTLISVSDTSIKLRSPFDEHDIETYISLGSGEIPWLAVSTIEEELEKL